MITGRPARYQAMLRRLGEGDLAYHEEGLRGDLEDPGLRDDAHHCLKVRLYLVTREWRTRPTLW